MYILWHSINPEISTEGEHQIKIPSELSNHYDTPSICTCTANTACPRILTTILSLYVYILHMQHELLSFRSCVVKSSHFLLHKSLLSRNRKTRFPSTLPIHTLKQQFHITRFRAFGQTTLNRCDESFVRAETLGICLLSSISPIVLPPDYCDDIEITNSPVFEPMSLHFVFWRAASVPIRVGGV